MTSEWTVPNPTRFPSHQVKLAPGPFPIRLRIGGPANLSAAEARGIAKALMAAADEAEGKTEPINLDKIWLLPNNPVSEEATRLELAQLEARAEVLRGFLGGGLRQPDRAARLEAIADRAASIGERARQIADSVHVAGQLRDSVSEIRDDLGEVFHLRIVCARPDAPGLDGSVDRGVACMRCAHGDSSTSAGRPDTVLTISVEVSGGRGADSRPCRCGGAS